MLMVKVKAVGARRKAKGKQEEEEEILEEEEKEEEEERGLRCNGGEVRVECLQLVVVECTAGEGMTR